MLEAHGGAGYTFGALAILVVLPPGRKPSRAQLSQKRAGHRLCHPPQGQQLALSSVGRHAAVAWRSVSVGVPTRAENSPGGGLGEAERHCQWQG